MTTEDSINHSQWHYQKVFTLMHESQELIMTTKKLMVEQEKPNIETNQKICENLVGASAALYSCTEIISAMKVEEN